MSKIYAISAGMRTSVGHGDSFSESVICRMGAYGSEGWPPCFTTKEAAEGFVEADAVLPAGTRRFWLPEIIELELMEAK